MRNLKASEVKSIIILLKESSKKLVTAKLDSIKQNKAKSLDEIIALEKQIEKESEQHKKRIESLKKKKKSLNRKTFRGMSLPEYVLGYSYDSILDHIERRFSKLLQSKIRHQLTVYKFEGPEEAYNQILKENKL